MTQEEIQQKAYEVYPLDFDRHLIIEGEPYDNNRDKREAYIRGLTDSKLSLPSNLDEAAEEFAYSNWEDNDYHTGASKGLPFDAIGHTEKCFKAGAEWMAGQFQKIDGSLVDWYETSDGKDYCCGIKTNEAFEVPEGFYIRKKQPGESLKEKDGI